MNQPYYVLEIEYDNGDVTTLEIDEPQVILGRSKKRADYQVDDAKASSQHVTLRFDDGVLTVKDMGSTNGTGFRGKGQAAAFKLPLGEHFEIGDTYLRLVEVVGFEEEVEATKAIDPEALARLKGEILGGSVDATLRSSPQGTGPLAPVVDALKSPLHAKADATIAFDRADVEIGELDESWRGPRREPARPTAPEPDDEYEDDDEEEDEEISRAGGVVGFLALLLAIGAVALGVLIAFKPLDPELKPIKTVGGHSATPLMKVAITSWTFVNEEYWFAALLGGEAYEMTERHYKKSEGFYTVLTSDTSTPEEKDEATEGFFASVEFTKSSAKMFAGKMDTIKIGLWIACGATLVAAILIFVGFRRIGGVLMLLGAASPLLVKQPAPVEPLYFTAAVALFAIVAFVSYWIPRRD